MIRRLGIAWLVAAALLGSPTEADAQTPSDFAIWSAVFFTGQLYADEPSPTFWFDGHARRSDNGTVVIMRPAFGGALTPWASLWLGYAWVPEWTDLTGERTDEHRVWQQIIFDANQVPGLVMQSRTRFEQRFLNGFSGAAHRFRQFVRVNYRPSAKLPVAVAFWDELFIGMSSAGWAKRGFDQNRAFLGLAVHAVDGRLRVEVGYLNVVITREQRSLSHVLALNFFVPFKGKKNRPQTRGR